MSEKSPFQLAAGGREGIRQRVSSNVVWQGTNIAREDRERRQGHQAAVLWFTGLSGAGKSTIAGALEKRLFEMGCRTMPLDGDTVRHGLCGDLGFSDRDRTENIRRVAEVAKLFFDNGVLALCTFISPFRADRAFARSLLTPGRFFEIFVRCDIEVCKRRDPKGLYRRALAGEIKDFTGVTSPYEEPEQPELVVETDLSSVETIVEQILDKLRAAGILAGL